MAKPIAGDQARSVALDLLQAVLRQKRPLDEALAAHEGLGRLDPRDRGFARMLTATCLRRLGEIDQAIAPLLATPLPAKASAVADALRLGACQLLFLGTPPHAAVSETVALVAGLGALGGGYKGLANALLRRLDRERPATDPARNVPAWLAESWTAAYGPATAAAIAAAHLREAPLDLSVKADAGDWAERLGAEILPTGTLRLADASGGIEAMPGFAEGAWWVQDVAAALPAVLLDAPCSATGTIRRRPDLPWLKRPEDLPKLTALQDRLLDNAVAMTAPNGVIVYATCSLQPEEGPARIAALLARGAPVARFHIGRGEVGGLGELLTPEGELRSLPSHLA